MTEQATIAEVQQTDSALSNCRKIVHSESLRCTRSCIGSRWQTPRSGSHTRKANTAGSKSMLPHIANTKNAQPIAAGKLLQDIARLPRKSFWACTCETQR